MRFKVNHFSVHIILLTAACALLELVWNRYAPESLTMKSGYLLLLLFALIVSVVHLFMLHAAQSGSSAFIRFFMGGTALKMMAFLLLLVIYLMFAHENERGLILHFLFYYLVFTALEIRLLSREMKKPK